MPGTLLHMGATVLCLHGGQATPGSAFPRVMVGGKPIVILSNTYNIAGCSLPPSAGGPCTTSQFISAATRVMANGKPVLLNTSQALCVPTSMSLNITTTQFRVKGQ